MKSPDDTKTKTAAAKVLQAALKRAEIQPLYKAGAEYQRVAKVNQEDTEEKKSSEVKKKAGRPKGSKDTFKRMPKTKTRILNL